ncbi:alpha/beta hydrolase [Piscinibacter sp.]|jgi:alpha-beta hydrolase superfamily lysophospholipase|uniref:alpha/beta hydrolase n=1 Tax=Piscinibacter sp. TaxID=1903157 RepID=UPI00355AB3F1
MKALPLHLPSFTLRRPSWRLSGAVAALAALMGFASFEAQQRKWIFQAGLRPAEASAHDSAQLQDRWIEYESLETGAPVRLHAHWLAAARPDAPVLLYLHGARWDLRGSVHRMQQLHEMGFGVLGIDYRGFGQSTPALPSERMVVEDARAAWEWLTREHGQAPRYVYGHSLGGAIAVQLASEIEDVAGLIVEGTFTSLPELFGTMRWGWLPLEPLITQRFDSAQRMPLVRAPLLVVHGSEDELIQPALGRALFELATAPKRFLLVEGGSHHDTHVIGEAQVREALRELFGLAA